MSMTAFPMDSQVSEIGEDGLPVYDRAFDSTDLREVYKTYFGDGYFAEVGTSMHVKAASGMTATVEVGKVNIRGTLGFMDEDATVEFEKAGSAERVDTVVARLDLSVEKRVIELDVLRGVDGSTTAPSLTRNATVWELGLADVTIPAKATAVTAENIKDTRLDTTRCGVVEPFAKLDTASLFEQVTAIVTKAGEDAEALVADTRAQTEALVEKATTDIDTDISALEKATTDAVSAMNDALSSTVLGSVWRLQSSSTADYLAYGDDLNNITGVGSKFCESASIAGGIQNKPANVTGAFALYTFAAEQDPSRLGQIILTCDGNGVNEYRRSGAGTKWTGWAATLKPEDFWDGIMKYIPGTLSPTASLDLSDIGSEVTTYNFMAAQARIYVKVGNATRVMFAPVTGAAAGTANGWTFSLSGCAEYDDGNDATLFFHLLATYHLETEKLTLEVGGAIGGSITIEKKDISNASLSEIYICNGAYPY